MTNMDYRDGRQTESIKEDRKRKTTEGNRQELEEASPENRQGRSV
jgi:hypothetical protein